MSHFTHFEMRFTGFLFPKRGCALYSELRSIHHFKGLNKGCVIYAGVSYTRKITVTRFEHMH